MSTYTTTLTQYCIQYRMWTRRNRTGLLTRGSIACTTATGTLHTNTKRKMMKIVRATRMSRRVEVSLWLIVEDWRELRAERQNMSVMGAIKISICSKTSRLPCKNFETNNFLKTIIQTYFCSTLAENLHYFLVIFSFLVLIVS